VRITETDGLRVNASSVHTYNVMATLKIAKPDFEKIVKNLAGGTYNESLHSVDKHIGDCLFHVFSTGSVSCIGSSREQLRKSAYELLACLRSIGIDVPQQPRIEFHSVTSEIRLRKKLRLWKALYLLDGAKLSAKGPRLLSYSTDNPRATVQLCEDGTIRCIGARNDRVAKQALLQVAKLIDELGLASGHSLSMNKKHARKGEHNRIVC
jgi:TATA-box binding protein (TBP) (component of TFIID and TFIIIB)